MTRGERDESPAASEPPWYAEGLRFRCTGCGECCTGVPGYVWVTDDDMARMARALGLSVRRFRKLHARRAKGKWSLKERAGGDCELLRDGKCLVYEAKPIRCSTFPFWTEVLFDRSEWVETAGRCEGIDQGDHYGREEIERLAAGDPRPLLTRQAAPEPAEERSETARMDAALKGLERLYADVERELPRYQFTCAASGRCCDFDAWGHRLYVTTIEAEYFFRRLGDAPLHDDPRRCPAYGLDRLCHARVGRMLGCRTFFCAPYPVAPPEALHEKYHQRLKALHDKHGIPFAYKDVVEWARER